MKDQSLHSTSKDEFVKLCLLAIRSRTTSEEARRKMHIEEFSNKGISPWADRGSQNYLDRVSDEELGAFLKGIARFQRLDLLQRVADCVPDVSSTDILDLAHERKYGEVESWKIRCVCM